MTRIESSDYRDIPPSIIIEDSTGRAITIDSIEPAPPPFVVYGCPVADGGASCCHNCGGGWPKTKIPTEAMTEAVFSGKIQPDQPGCQPLADRVKEGMEYYAKLRGDD